VATACPIEPGLRVIASRVWGAFLVTAAMPMAMAGGPPVRAADDADPVEAPAPAELQRDLLVTGRDLMTAGEPRRAIDECFDKVIRYFEQTYQDSERAVYSSQGLQMSLLYSSIPRHDKKGVEVLDSTWGDAYLLKAYALVNLGELQRARAELEAALVVSPMSAKYMSELAYTYAAERNYDRAIELYRKAAKFAEVTSSGSRLNEDLARAWRGEAFALTGQGKYRDARALYGKCLELDPQDRVALNELRRLDQLEKR
jgi:tetratricopeptide (TPR) repeat protein